jgi:hypothetical protein
MVSTDNVLYPRSTWPRLSYSTSTTTCNHVGPTDETGIEWTTSYDSTAGDEEFVELTLRPGMCREEPEPAEQPKKIPTLCRDKCRDSTPPVRRRIHQPPGGYGFYRG